MKAICNNKKNHPFKSGNVYLYEKCQSLGYLYHVYDETLVGHMSEEQFEKYFTTLREKNLNEILA